MPFTVNDVQDLTRVLALHPEWLAEVRRLVLTAELLALPDIVSELAAAQKQTEQRVAELGAAQKQTEQRVAELGAAQKQTEQRVAELVTAQRQTEQRVAELVAAQTRAELRLDRLEQQMVRVNDQLGYLRGRDLERKYRENIAAYFGSWLWPAQAVEVGALRDELEQRLSQDQIAEVLLLDLVVRGTARRLADKPVVWLAVEISTVIDRADVERARQRAALLRQAGYRAAPVVAGEALTLGAESAIASAPIVVLRDGQSQGWDAALTD